MSFPNWKVQPEIIFCTSPVIPVVVIKEIDHAVPLATALFAGGIHIIEVALRTPVALDAIKLLADTFPEALIGAGTVITPQQLKQVESLGAKFALSPGKTQDLLLAGCDSSIPLIPGISSISELMDGLVLGYTHFKFFPATVAGGSNMLRAIYGPFPQARFCPTGGINEGNFGEYLALPNVSCVGGSWIVPEEATKKGNWSLITDLSFAARQSVRGWD
ncbi:bifunctional 4-hydroxy-2-oxoglutarate aldolase/2-dehydro-3-deoxy-phosphogluconate aldolase [Fluoribacter dumoffii]|uniref:KHG/KDPG aldolase n=1 Tax=Fluoribacter dumoffii TaxID=463 RepID=A0A377GDK7_9GAMM|nr:bifunctional 4-hydroxy-2-oxoglutarate aldolase/2-dehydro-3-deoxy-phosphogluconate aldolase [Fluoribacter dumoffii]KTC90773.1 2-deydro-3-deoxyphosphogluconate aldolase/4-hydroxy-2-oxoglutarate aldolase [Fluoribacter dumoffii NY 23]MCW8386616.1 bifunctional 4-hydroxy-2-oxoglutarate aldolase/2-dehydro-3-deoxy-phosphogluconate aldolase [Fluoribacter dumoffii]MCW8419670.1 bifunctional 4-hydroxy-2-oxoglutarate aldolase/2-dehydro-3-deoxy-phosphogluconate aldolase [Fluoribacter dumoffii]MCW8455627.1